MKRVLVVEDNSDNLRLVTYFLMQNGYDVIPAVTGEDGVKKSQENKCSFILMDILLPGIDGMEATKQIRSQEKEKRTPIIAFTSYTMRGDREKILAAGCDGYIEKPINPDRFMKEIDQILQLGSQMQCHLENEI